MKTTKDFVREVNGVFNGNHLLYLFLSATIAITSLLKLCSFNNSPAVSEHFILFLLIILGIGFPISLMFIFFFLYSFSPFNNKELDEIINIFERNSITIFKSFIFESLRENKTVTRRDLRKIYLQHKKEIDRIIKKEKGLNAARENLEDEIYELTEKKHKNLLLKKLSS